jgi:hypothetical protein
MSLGPDADHVKLTATCGGALVGAVIVVINEGTNVPRDQAVGGALTSSCGAWDATVFAHSGDPLVITQEINGAISQPTTIWVR